MNVSTSHLGMRRKIARGATIASDIIVIPKAFMIEVDAHRWAVHLSFSIKF